MIATAVIRNKVDRKRKEKRRNDGTAHMQRGIGLKSKGLDSLTTFFDLGCQDTFATHEPVKKLQLKQTYRKLTIFDFESNNLTTCN
uniref:Uncharacterized protein n=1 Tax=Ascaris lumbricoides TaxID=6252 RepID=A0A0M3IL71_ASCLU